jgi:hypothetical protein
MSKLKKKTSFIHICRYTSGDQKEYEVQDLAESLQWDWVTRLPSGGCDFVYLSRLLSQSDSHDTCLHNALTLFIVNQDIGLHYTVITAVYCDSHYSVTITLFAQ